MGSKIEVGRSQVGRRVGSKYLERNNVINQNLTEKEIENVCNRFAGAILIPQSKIIAEFGPLRKGFYLLELIEIQKEWGISIQAFIYRAKDLEIITQSKYSSFFFHLNTKPQFRSEVDEPRFALLETSYRFNQLLYKGLAQELISISKASVLSDQSLNILKNTLSHI